MLSWADFQVYVLAGKHHYLFTTKRKCIPVFLYDIRFDFLTVVFMIFAQARKQRIYTVSTTKKHHRDTRAFFPVTLSSTQKSDFQIGSYPQR